MALINKLELILIGVSSLKMLQKIVIAVALDTKMLNQPKLFLHIMNVFVGKVAPCFSYFSCYVWLV